jgi:hypothetical protein
MLQAYASGYVSHLCANAILEPWEEVLAHSNLIRDRGIPHWELYKIMVDS